MSQFRLLAGEGDWLVESWGKPGNPVVVLLHGFTWCGAAWKPVAEALSRTHYVVAPDLPGHGGTAFSWPPELATFEQISAGLAELFRRLTSRPITLVGYSMGGRLALHLACTAPELLERLIVIGASAGLATEAARQERWDADRSLAADIRRDGTEAFLERWSALPMFESMRTLPTETKAWMRSLRELQDPDGLASALEALSVSRQPYMLPLLPSVQVPTTVVVGSLDSKFRTIADSLLEVLPSAQLEVVPETGHAVPLERPAAIAALLTRKELIHA